MELMQFQERLPSFWISGAFIYWLGVMKFLLLTNFSIYHFKKCWYSFQVDPKTATERLLELNFKDVKPKTPPMSIAVTF